VLIAIPCYYWLGMAGIALAVILGYAATLVVTWWFSRRVPIPDAPCSIADSRAEARLLIVFGLPIMLSGLVGTFSPYVERVILLRYLGLDAVGQYQAAFSLAGFTVTFVLAAMSADYYPKLVAHADEPERFNEEMNAQLRVALLLSIPALAWLAVLSQRATSLLYSSAFSPSGEVLRIMIIGVLGRIVAAPLRLALLAKGKGKTIFAVEVISALVGFALISFFAGRLGLIGCGWAFTALHLGTGIVLAMVLPSLVGQSVSASNKLLVLWSSLILIGLWLNHAMVTTLWMRVSIGLVLATGASVACLYFLTQLMGWSFLNKIRQ
ncbi:MAG: oligosaccharide flippase family protein, partial [bacterium]